MRSAYVLLGYLEEKRAAAVSAAFTSPERARASSQAARRQAPPRRQAFGEWLALLRAPSTNRPYALARSLFNSARTAAWFAVADEGRASLR